MENKRKEHLFRTMGLAVVVATAWLVWWAWNSVRLWVALPVIVGLWTAVGMLDSVLYSKPWPWDEKPGQEGK